MESAIVQALLDNDDHPDGPFLGDRFWELLEQTGKAPELIARAKDAVLVDGLWQERE